MKMVCGQDDLNYSGNRESQNAKTPYAIPTELHFC